MDPLESNPSLELTELLSTDYAKLTYFNISIKNNDLYSLNGSITSFATPSAQMELVFYLDQAVKHIDPYAALEKHIARFLEKVDGVFTQRSLNYHTEDQNTVVNYTVMLYDYSKFTQSLHSLYIKRLDKEFTKALEAELSKD